MVEPAPLTSPTSDSGEEYSEVVSHFDAFAKVEGRWRRRTATYHRLIEQIARNMVPPGRRVLEVGSGGGDLLAALEPREGVGVELSPAMVELARRRHPDLQFVVGAGETTEPDQTFDYVVLSDVVPYVYDLLGLLENVRGYSHRRTRVVINSYNPTWRQVIAGTRSITNPPAAELSMLS
jgi:SAM-dependent methyltransferase